MYRVFVKDGFVYAECVNRNGTLICHPTGFFRFPVYSKNLTKKKTDATQESEGQSSEEE